MRSALLTVTVGGADVLAIGIASDPPEAAEFPAVDSDF